MIHFEIFSNFPLLVVPATFTSTLPMTNGNILMRLKLGFFFFLLLHERTHHIGLTTWSVIICLNECHAMLYCLSPDSNTSLYWQLFWKHNSPHGTNEKTKQGKCTANNEWTQFAKGIYTYKQCEAKCTLQKAGGRWTLKHIYLAIHFSGGLISKGSVEAEQKYNTISNMVEEVKNKVNERFKAP